MWQIKRFKTQAAMRQWIETNGHNYQFIEVFINNGFALDIRRLRPYDTM